MAAVAWSNGNPDGNPPDAEMQFATGSAVLHWHAGNDWRIPVGDISVDVWPQLALAAGLALDDGGTIVPLPTERP